MAGEAVSNGTSAPGVVAPGAGAAPAPPAGSQAVGLRDALAQQARINQQKLTLKSESEALRQRGAKVAGFETLLEEVRGKKNIDALVKGGYLTLDDLKGFVGAGGKITPDSQAASAIARVEQLEQQLKDRDAKAETAQQEQSRQQADAAAAQWAGTTVKALHAATEKYPHIAALQNGPAVIAEVERLVRADPESFQTEEALNAAVETAAAAVEKRNVEMLPTEIKRLLSVPSIRELVLKELGTPATGAKGADGVIGLREKTKSLTSDQKSGTGPAPVAGEKGKTANQIWQDMLARAELKDKQTT